MKKFNMTFMRRRGMAWKTLLLVMAVASVCAGCRRWSHHGDFDGFWQIQSIEYTSGPMAGTTVEMPELYMAVNLELLQLQRSGHNPEYTGVLAYDRKAGRFTVDWRGGVSQHVLDMFGFGKDPTTATIRQLDSKRLVFQTDIALISCRRY